MGTAHFTFRAGRSGHIELRGSSLLAIGLIRVPYTSVTTNVAFDSLSKKKLALQNGATEIHYGIELARMLERRDKGLSLK